MSGANRIDHTEADRLIKRIATLERELLHFKSVQPIGGDVLQISPTPLLIGGPATIAAGSALTYNVIFTPASHKLTQWDIKFDVLVDVSDSAYVYPSGASLSAGQLNMLIEQWASWADSSDTSNTYVQKIRIHNNDSVAHDYYLWIKAYLPTLSGSG